MTTDNKALADKARGEICAEDIRWCEDIAEALQEAGGPTNNMRLVGLRRLLKAALSTPQARPDGWDAQAYTNMRDDLESWKHRALNAEADMNRLCDQFNAENGPTHMGEPVLPQLVEQARPDGGAVARTGPGDVWDEWTRKLRRLIGDRTEKLHFAADVQADGDGVRFDNCRFTRPAPAPDVARLVEVAGAIAVHQGGSTESEWERLHEALAPFTAAQQEGGK